MAGTPSRHGAVNGRLPRSYPQSPCRLDGSILLLAAALAVDDAGTLLIASGNQVLKVEPDTGRLSPFAGAAVAGGGGDGPALDARLSTIEGLIVAPGGGLRISDTDNGRIRCLGRYNQHGWSARPLWNSLQSAGGSITMKSGRFEKTPHLLEEMRACIPPGLGSAPATFVRLARADERCVP